MNLNPGDSGNGTQPIGSNGTPAVATRSNAGRIPDYGQYPMNLNFYNNTVIVSNSNVYIGPRYLQGTPNQRYRPPHHQQQNGPVDPNLGLLLNVPPPYSPPIYDPDYTIDPNFPEVDPSSILLSSSGSLLQSPPHNPVSTNPGTGAQTSQPELIPFSSFLRSPPPSLSAVASTSTGTPFPCNAATTVEDGDADDVQGVPPPPSSSAGVGRRSRGRPPKPPQRFCP